MTGDNIDNEFDQFDRPFEPVAAPELSRLSDVPEWKQPDMDNRMQHWEEEHPYATTDFKVPHYLTEDDWW